jgi:hypothetical protein
VRDHHADWKTWPDGDGRLDVERAADHLLAGLVDALRHTLLNGLGERAVVVAADASLRSDAEQRGEDRPLEQHAPVVVDLVLEDVKRLAAQAQRMPGQQNSFKNLILNMRVAAHTPFIQPAVWKACGGPAHITPGSRIYAALDLGSTRDMSALVLIAEDLEGVFHVEPWFWLPGNVWERESEDQAPYREWVHEGYLESIGEATDPKVIALRIAELNGQYGIQTLAYDRWRIGDLKRELDAIGCIVKLVPHGQGFKGHVAGGRCPGTVDHSAANSPWQPPRPRDECGICGRYARCGRWSEARQGEEQGSHRRSRCFGNGAQYRADQVGARDRCPGSYRLMLACYKHPVP